MRARAEKKKVYTHLCRTRLESVRRSRKEVVTNLLSSITSAHQSCEGSVNMQLHIGLLTYTCADTLLKIKAEGMDSVLCS